MSEFSHSKLKRLTDLYKQYAQDILIQKGKEPKQTVQSRLGFKGLQQLLWNANVYLSEQKAIDIICKYDSTLTGTLDLTDFLLFFHDFAATMQSKKQKATELWQSYASGTIKPDLKAGQLPIAQFMERYSSLQTYLVFEKLNDPQNIIFDKEDTLVSLWTREGFVGDYHYLKRKLLIRIASAKNMQLYWSPNYVETFGIFFNTQSVMVRVQVANQSTPIWEQDLSFNIDIREGPVHEIVQWASSQNIYFSLFDIRTHDGVPQPHLIGSASYPLIKVFQTDNKMTWTELSMTRTDGLFQEAEAVIEVGMCDVTHENYPFTKILDAEKSADEVWATQDPSAFEKNLISILKETNLKSVESFESFTSTKATLRKVFKTRMYDTLAKNEKGDLNFLGCFIKPYKTAEINTALEAANAVASIPFRHSFVPITSMRPDKNLMWNQIKSQDAVQWQFRACMGFWSSQKNSWSMFSHNPYAPILPSAVIFSLEKRATLMEKCILLVNLLLGLSIDAYVAVGQVEKRPFCWVVSFENGTDPTLIQVEASQIQYDSKTIAATKFEKVGDLKAALKSNSGKVIKFWDVVTGKWSYKQPLNLQVLFNHKNVYYNIQKIQNASRPLFIWDLNDERYWIPLFKEKFAGFPQIYQVLVRNSFSTSSFKNEKTLLTTLIKFIQMYRQENIHVTETLFHREACKKLGDLMENFEQMRLELKDSSQLWKIVKSSIESVLLPGNSWHLGVFRFLGTDLEHIIYQIALSGILDNSAKDVLYIISAKIVKHPFGFYSAWIGVGYTIDLLYKMATHA